MAAMTEALSKSIDESIAQSDSAAPEGARQYRARVADYAIILKPRVMSLVVFVGLVGICLLLIVYLLLIGRGLMITAQAQTLFGKLLAGSLTMTFFVYVFVNIGMVSGLLPVVGVPLPFISYGGTSLVTLLSAFGVLMSIHTHRKWIAQV